MIGRILSTLVILAVLLVVPVILLTQLDYETVSAMLPSWEEITSGKLTEKTDQLIGENFPAGKTLKSLAINIERNTGMAEIDGVFFGKNSLVRNAPEPDTRTVNRNINALTEFVSRYRIPTYLTVIPTASAILQDQTPSYDGVVYNQRSFLDQVYKRLEGQVNAADVYPALFANMDDYIYYRTMDTLTAKGGYYVYSSIISRLGSEPEPLKNFEISYFDNHYFGELYDIAPSLNISPDMIFAYRFTKSNRPVQVTHFEKRGNKSYYSLFPSSASTIKQDDMLRYLGGLSPIVEIQSPRSAEGKLLVFGDETAMSYLPFLSLHYQKITFVNLSEVAAADLYAVDVLDYDQALFAYGYNTFSQDEQLTRLKYIYSTFGTN